MTDFQVEPNHFYSQEYDNKIRFISYWHQIDEVLSLHPEEILEIGVGNKFFTKYLKDRGLRVTTLDLDSRLDPDVLANVLEIPFLDDCFEVITCFELLEHLPYTSFLLALKELNRVAKSNVILSLPDVTTVYRVYIELPRIRPIKIMIRHPIPRPSVHRYDGQHHWEIGKRNFPLKKIENEIISSGFKIIKTYRIFEYPYHRFFLLSCL
jgi:hypothetical protein